MYSIRDSVSTKFVQMMTLAVIFLPVSPASYTCTHNFSLGLTNFICESLDSENIVENCSKICFKDS